MTRVCDPSIFHREFCLSLDRLEPGGRLCVLAPRGSAKSTYASLAFPLRQALVYREPFVVLCSDTSGQARDFLRQIKREVETNELLRATYPEECRPGRVWRDDRLTLASGTEVLALGTGGKIRGRKSAGNRRPTLVLLDDLQNKDHIQSPLRRERSWEWLTKDMLAAGEPGTRFVCVGTPLHRECIVSRLRSAPGWTSRVYRAIRRWPQRMDLWAQWQDLLHDYDDPEREQKAREFYEANRRAMDE